MSQEKLELRYIPLTQAKRWDENPKLHDLEALLSSIERDGFGDPPKYDSQLNGLAYGNGRTEALERMRSEGKPPPRGILELKDGDWAVPVIFGVDADSRASAVAFAVDHNNLTLMGGDFDLSDVLSMWDEEELKKVLGEVPSPEEVLASFNVDDLSVLLDGPEFEPVGAEEQSQLDEKKTTTCLSVARVSALRCRLWRS